MRIMSIGWRRLGLVAMLACAACGQEKTAIADQAQARSGKFVYLKADDEQLREYTLPEATNNLLVQFPLEGMDANGTWFSNVSACGEGLLTDLSEERSNTDYVYQINPRTRALKRLREGSVPTCGPNGRFYFFDVDPSVRRTALYTATLAAPEKAQLLISGEYALPANVVPIGDQYVASYDPRIRKQVIFEVMGERLQQVFVGDDCEPEFWRPAAKELACADEKQVLRSHKLFAPAEHKIIDLKRRGIGRILYYWPESDEFLGLVSSSEWLRETYDLVAFDVQSGRKTVLARDVDVGSNFARIAPAAASEAATVAPNPP